MKRLLLPVLLLFALGAAHAQTSVPARLTSLQKEMLQSPGAHLCGDAVTNVPCDELERAKKNNYSTDVIPYGRKLSMTQAAKWTSPLDKPMVDHSHWHQVVDDDQSRIWLAYVQGRNGLVEIAVKVAFKGLSGDISEIDDMHAMLRCGANGALPDAVFMTDVEKYSGMNVPMGGQEINASQTVDRGTNLATVVQETCLGVLADSMAAQSTMNASH